MKIVGTRFRRILLWAGIFLFSLLLLGFIFLSPITRYLIEKYSRPYTGRQVRIEKLFINLFTGSIHAGGLRIYEQNGKDVFFSCQDFTGRLSIPQLLAGRYDVTTLDFDGPSLQLIQRGKRFNFSDLINRYARTHGSSSGSSKPVYFRIRHFRIRNARLVYINQLPYNKVELSRGNFEIPLIQAGQDHFSLLADFVFPAGGAVKANLQYNDQTGGYNCLLNINQLQLSWLYPYLKDYLKAQSLQGLLSTDLKLDGNSHRPAEIALSGNLGLGDFSIIDNTGESLVRIGNMRILVDSINVKENLYNISEIKMERPFLRLSLYPDGYNFDRLRTSPVLASAASDSLQSYSNLFTLLAGYIDDIVKNYVVSHYNAGSLTVTDGSLLFDDYTLNDKFQFRLDSLRLSSERFSSSDSMISLTAAAWLNRTGHLKAGMRISPSNYSNFELEGIVSDQPISDFNPYTEYYVATPFTSGQIFYRNRTRIENRRLENDNQLDILQVNAGRKLKNKTAMKLPVRLAVSLLKDVKGDIHLNIPVRGSLDDPRFRWGRIVWQVLKNLLLKAAAAPYKLLAGKIGGSESSFREMPFDYGQTTLSLAQQQQLDLLASALQKDSTLQLTMQQELNRQDEAEFLALNLARKKFLGISTDSLSSLQKQQIQQLSSGDSAFQAFLNKELGAVALQSVAEKCIRLAGGRESMLAAVERESQKRKESILAYLFSRGIATNRISFQLPPDEEVISRNQKPFYQLKIGVSGDNINSGQTEVHNP